MGQPADKAHETLRSAVDAYPSLRRLGRESDTDPAMLSRFARGQADMTFTNACKLLKPLGLEIRKSKKGGKRG